MKYILEIATTDYTSTKAAVEGGADRIELCAALDNGGITPSYAILKKCREAFSLPMFVMIRPRDGDFHYNDEELSIILEDIKIAKTLGFEGVVCGSLTKKAEIDKEQTAKMIQVAWPMEFTYHKAFDRTRDAFEAIKVLEELGVNRLLTSGQETTAVKGVEMIAELKRTSSIEILVGGGVRADNIKGLVKATECREYHSAARSKVESKMEYANINFPNLPWSGLKSEDVRAIKNALNEID